MSQFYETTTCLDLCDIDQGDCAKLYSLDKTGVMVQNDLFSTTVTMLTFVKAYFLSPIYLIALSTQGELVLFNLAARLSIGTLRQFPFVRDFCVCRTVLDESQSGTAGDCCGLPSSTLVILRSPNENDPPLTADDMCTSALLELVTFPTATVLYTVPVSPNTWLLSTTDYGVPEQSNSWERIYYMESLPVSEGTSSRMIMKKMDVVGPEQRIMNLLQENRFDEAEKLLQLFPSSASIHQTFALSHIRWCLATAMDNKLQEPDDQLTSEKPRLIHMEVASQLLNSLSNVAHPEQHEDIMTGLLDLVMPTAASLTELLTYIKERLCSTETDANLDLEVYKTKVFTDLKRLRAFLLIYGPERYDIDMWQRFRQTPAYVQFAHFLVTGTSSGRQPSEGADPSQAFIFWGLYKNELYSSIDSANLELLLSILAARPLTYTQEHVTMTEHFERDFVAVESAVHRWLRWELLPVVVTYCPASLVQLAQFVTQRVRQLEACHTRASTTTTAEKTAIQKSPFAWPSSALSWVDGILVASQQGTDDDVDNAFETPGDVVNRFLSGLASRDPEVDPFHGLRTLAKQLRTIDILLEQYNLRLTLDSCSDENELSIAYRILEGAFNSGIPFVDGVDKLTARYLADRQIDPQAFYLSYALDLLGRIKTMRKDQKVNDVYQSRRDEQTMLEQLCLVAGWITVPICLIRIANALTTTVPFPWPTEVLGVVERAIEHGKSACLSTSTCLADQGAGSDVGQFNHLTPLANLAHVQKIIARYGVEDYSCITHCHTATDLVHEAVSLMVFAPFKTQFTNFSLATTTVEDARALTKILIPATDRTSVLASALWRAVLQLATSWDLSGSEQLLQLNPEIRLSFIILQLHSIVSDSAGLSGTPKYISTQKSLVRQALAYINELLTSGCCTIKDQELFIKSLVLCLTQSTPLDQSCGPITSAQASCFHSYCTNLGLGSELVPTLGWLSYASFEDRTKLLHVLTLRLVQRQWKLGVKTTSCPESLLNPLYRLGLPELQGSIRRELLQWNWFSLSVQNEWNEPSNSLTMARDLLQNLANILTTTLWISPIGRTGAVLQLAYDAMCPLLTQTLPTVDTLPSSINSWLRDASQCLESFMQLWLWAGGSGLSRSHQIGPDRFDCPVYRQAVTSQYEGIRQILHAYIDFISGVSDVLSSSSGPHDDDQWAPSSRSFSQRQIPKVTSMELLIETIKTSFLWLTDLLACVLKPTVLNDELERHPPSSSKELIEGAVQLASSWSSQYHMSLSVSLPFCIGLARLFNGATGIDLKLNQPVDSSIAIDDVECTPALDYSRYANVFSAWSEFCDPWMVNAFNSALHPPTDGGYLDQLSVLNLAQASPMEEATSIVKQLIAAKRDSPKLVKALTSTVYAFALIAPRRASQLLEHSRIMGKSYHWQAALKPHGLSFTQAHQTTQGNGYQSLLDKLCRIVPVLPGRSGTPCDVTKGILIPSRSIPQDPFAPAVSTTRSRSLPSVELIESFTHDFNLCFKQSLIQHLRALFTPSVDILALCSSGEGQRFFEPVPAMGGNVDDGETDASVDSTAYRSYQTILLERASLFLKRLLSLSKTDQAAKALVQLLQEFMSSTSPYDYERMQFLFLWLGECAPDSVQIQNLKLLRLVTNYTRLRAPSDSEREPANNESIDQDAMFSNLRQRHPLSHIRLPYHLLLVRSPPMEIIGPEVTMDNLSFWIRVDRTMEWAITDKLRLLAATNFVDQHERIGMLPMKTTSTHASVPAVSTSAGWECGLLCQTVTAPFFQSLHALLSTVNDQIRVMHFLSRLSQRVAFGPHSLAIMVIARAIANTSLLSLEEQARVAFADDPEASVRIVEHLTQRIEWSRNALHDADARHRQLSMQGCLYENRLAYWEDINNLLREPSKLITQLLSRIACIEMDQAVSTTLTYTRLPVSDLSLRNRLLGALPQLIELAGMDLFNLSQLVLTVLRLPLQILQLNNSNAMHDCSSSNQSLLLDTSTGSTGINPCDITLNATFAPAISHPNLSLPQGNTTNTTAPSATDYLVVEMLLRQPVIREDLLPSLLTYVFTGDANANVPQRWLAARCILRAQVGFLLWPRLSLTEIRSVLIRLALLSKCTNHPAYQRLLSNASVNQDSQLGHTFTAICSQRVVSCVEHLLTNHGINELSTELATSLIIDYQLTSHSVLLSKLLYAMHAQPCSSQSLRLLEELCRCKHLWRSFDWLWHTTMTKGGESSTELLRRIIAAALESAWSTRSGCGLRFSHLMRLLFSWPFPDAHFDQALTHVTRQLNQPLEKTTTDVLYKRVLLTVCVHVLGLTCCRVESVQSLQHPSIKLDELAKSVDNKTVTILVSDALAHSELTLTPSYFQCMGLCSVTSRKQTDD